MWDTVCCKANPQISTHGSIRWNKLLSTRVLLQQEKQTIMPMINVLHNFTMLCNRPSRVEVQWYMEQHSTVRASALSRRCMYHWDQANLLCVVRWSDLRCVLGAAKLALHCTWGLNKAFFAKHVKQWVNHQTRVTNLYALSCTHCICDNWNGSNGDCWHG